MDTRAVHHQGFSDVDRAQEAAPFISYLDAVSASEWFGAWKRRSFTLHEPREGSRLLDVGCGNGDDVRALATLVGTTGHVVGVDSSTAMVAEAVRRAASTGLPVTFKVCDVHHLDFPDDHFDGARADRTIQHVEDPKRAIAEMIRVTKPGGRVVVSEGDFDTIIIDAADQAVTRAIVHTMCDSRRNGWIIRQVPALFRHAGLVDVTIGVDTWIAPDYASAAPLLGFQSTVERAVESGAITTDQATAWLADLEARGAAGTFFCAMTGFMIGGRKTDSAPPRSA